jgi:hypothetical protein
MYGLFSLRSALASFAPIQNRINHPIQITLCHRRPGRQTQPPLKQILRHLATNHPRLIPVFILRILFTPPAL